MSPKARAPKKPAEFPYYRWDVRAWRDSQSVRVLTPLQRGIYRDLIDECIVAGGIPSDPSKIARLVGLSEDELRRDVWPAIAHFFEQTEVDSVLDNRKCNDERARLINASVKAATSRSQRRTYNERTTNVQRTLNDRPTKEKEKEKDISQSTAQTPPEVGIKSIPPSGPLSPDERRATLAAGGDIKAIETYDLSANGDRFNAGQWWGHSLKIGRRIVPMAATLNQLRRRLEAKDRPVSPWAYCEATYEEKRASYWADHAEREQASRKKEPAAPIVAELLGGIRGG